MSYFSQLEPCTIISFSFRFHNKVGIVSIGNKVFKSTSSHVSHPIWWYLFYPVEICERASGENYFIFECLKGADPLTSKAFWATNLERKILTTPDPI